MRLRPSIAAATGCSAALFLDVQGLDKTRRDEKVPLDTVDSKKVLGILGVFVKVSTDAQHVTAQEVMVLPRLRPTMPIVLFKQT